ncbi:hypothetical protein PO124_29335 [Bacillus licheniformis]|nr:hypothetical protein [Bacillus licheniformis]
MIIPIIFSSFSLPAPPEALAQRKGKRRNSPSFNIPSQTLDPNLDVNYTAIRAGISETLVKSVRTFPSNRGLPKIGKQRRTNLGLHP